MNIFVLDYNPVTAAQMLCDKHVVKMALETAQILSTVCGGPYRPTHVNHPCVKWAGDNRLQFNWLRRHGLAICDEYTRRYGKVHKSQAVIEQCKRPENMRVGVVDFVQCMPEEHKCEDAVQAYRSYYHSKADFATWKTSAPYWWKP
jgi:hypothetical protein